MESIDEIREFNDLIIELQAQLSKHTLQKELLIREAFVLWYVLIEGIACENFTEEEVSILLKKNYDTYITKFENDGDYCFIIGWVMSIAFWHFDVPVKEDYGDTLLFRAYRSNPKNSLFKWAVRQQLNLKENEIENLKIDISLRFDQLYNFGPLIREYFLELVNTRL